jgi:hypothetical protein
MDNLSMMCAMIGAAWGGALGAFLMTRFSKTHANSPARAAYALGPMLVLGLVGIQIAGHDGFRDWLHPPTRTERATRKHWQGLKDMEAFKRRVGGRSTAEASALSEQITRTGLKRLAPADLDRWNQLRQALATQSRGLCVGLWTGKIDRREVDATVEKLVDPDLDDWARISATAMRLELEAMAPDVNGPLARTLDPAYREALRRAVDHLLAPLPEAETQRMRRAFAAGAALGDDEACWAMQTTMKTAAELPPETREEVLRTFAAL